MHIVNIWNDKSRTFKNRQAYKKKLLKFKKLFLLRLFFLLNLLNVFYIFYKEKYNFYLKSISIIELRYNKCVQNKKILFLFF